MLAEVFVRWTCHLVWNRDMTYNPGELMGYSRWLKIGQLLDLVIARGYSMVLIGFKLSRFPSCENYSLVSDVSETAFPPRSGMLKGAAGNALRWRSKRFLCSGNYKSACLCVAWISAGSSFMCTNHRTTQLWIWSTKLSFFQAFNYSMGQVRRDAFARWRSVTILHVNPIYENEKPWPSTCSESTGCSRMLLSNSITSREQEMMGTAFQASGRCQQLGSCNSQTQLLHEEVKQMRQCKNS